MKLKITQLSLLLCLFGNHAFGQLWLGNTFSNYAGANGVYLNPSSIAESKYAYHVNLWGHGVNMYNNYLRYNAPLGVRDWIQADNTQYANSNGKINFDQSWLSEIEGNNTKQLSFTQDIRMPGFMFPVGPKASMSINLRQRQSAQAFGISTPFANVLRFGLDTNNARAYGGADGIKTNEFYDFGDFSSNIENYQELSFTYAGNWSKTEEHTFNVGSTIKFIRGLGGAYFNGSGGQFAVNGPDSITLNGGDFSYGHTPYTNIRQPIENDYQIFYPSAGSGLGFDFGLTYLYHPNKEKYLRPIGCNENDKRDNYLFKIAAAVNDIGFINYKDATSYNKQINTSGLKITNNIVGSFGNNAVDGFDTLNAGTFSPLGFDKSSAYVSQLPTALNMTVDFRATKRLFVGLNWNQDLKTNSATGMRSTSHLAVIPRFEFRGLELSVPMVLAENYKDFNVGVYTRLGPFFLGSENLNGLLNKVSNGSYNSADIYGGMAFGIGHCPLWVDEEYDEDIVRRDTLRYRDTIKTNDTIYKKNEVVKYDSFIKIEKDTILKTETRTDTVTIEKIIREERLERDLQRRESNVLARERNVTERERLVVLRENNERCVTCEREKRTLETRIREQQNEIEVLKTRIATFERETIALRKNKTATDTIRITDCGPKIYSDEMGNRFDKCEYLERTNKSLLLKITRLETDRNRLEDDLAKCTKEKEDCEKARAEIKPVDTEKETERLRIEQERIRQEATRRAAEEARKKAEQERLQKEENKEKEEARRAAEERARQTEIEKEAALKKQRETAESQKEEAKKNQEEARKKAQEAETRANTERAKAGVARQEAEAKRIAEERASKEQESARQVAARKAEEEKRIQEAARIEEARRKAEEEAAKKAAEKAKQEAARKAAEEARRKAEEEKKKEDLR